MKIYRDPAEVEPDFGPSAVTIGKFDGVHLGHRAVMAEVLRVSREHSLAATVVTFDRNPLAVLAPDRCPPSLVSLDQKLELLAGTGMDATLVLHFDEELAALSPEDFVTRVLVDALHAHLVLVGSDFRFGRANAGDVDMLRALGERHGFRVILVDDQRAGTGERVSSTRIRALLVAGDIEGASAMLGHLPTLRGEVVPGARRGRELGFPTANFAPDAEGLIPADGVYAGWLFDAGVRHPAAISVGNNPTFEGVPQRQVEAHVIGETIDLYGHVIEVSFVKRIRDNVAFAGIPALIAQMRADVAEVAALLAETP